PKRDRTLELGPKIRTYVNTRGVLSPFRTASKLPPGACENRLPQVNSQETSCLVPVLRKTTMATAIKGIIHGKLIELDEEPGLPEGKKVSVTVEPVPPATSPTSPEALESLRQAAGGWSDDPEGLEEFLRWNRQQRKGNRPEIPE